MRSCTSTNKLGDEKEMRVFSKRVGAMRASDRIGKIQCVYFSPKGSTRKILHTISENIGIQVTDSLDLTLPHQRESWTGKIECDLLLIGVPVYYGTIPSIMLSPLRKLQGYGKWSIPIAVFGNVGTGTMS